MSKAIEASFSPCRKVALFEEKSVRCERVKCIKKGWRRHRVELAGGKI